MTFRSVEDADRMRQCCRLTAELREKLRRMLKPDVETGELNSFVEKQLARWGAEPAFKGYRGFPASLCVSINDEVVHGIPGRRKLKDGDLVSLDVGVFFEGFYGDTAFSQGVGELDEGGTRLMSVTESALKAGIMRARAGSNVSDISSAVQKCVEDAGFSVVREFVGHGIGRAMHDDPQIPNYGEAGQGARLESGQALAIEPMVNEGSAGVRVLGDGWTAVTVDGRRSAHFEHTVMVTDDEPEVLTASVEAR